jgi:ribonuclease J
VILTVHRGSKQIGGSCVELRADGGERLLLDVGMPLTKPDGGDRPRGTMTRPSRELRAEGVLPNVDGLYVGSVPEFSGLVLSHAHLDHHGLAHHVHPDVPVYCSPGTTAMLEVSSLFVPDATAPNCTHALPTVDPVAIGPFAVRGIPVDHATPDSRALLVEADGQRVLYSGDLRAHGRHAQLFDSLPAAAGPVDVLILEGTTVGQTQGSHGYGDELDVERGLTDVLARDKDLVVVIASVQNIDRAISVYQAALNAGRELVLDPYQAFVLMKLKDICPDAPQFDSPSVRVKFIRSHVSRLKEAGFWDLACQMSRAGKVTTEQLLDDPRRFVYLARSSGATVGLMQHLSKAGLPTLVWSQWGGYLKRGGAVPRYCDAQGIEPVLIHSGGHACPEDLARLANCLRPRVVVPIHTEAALQFSALMQNVRVVDDDELVDLYQLLAD